MENPVTTSSSFNHRFALGLIKEETQTGKVISIKTFNDLFSLSWKVFLVVFFFWKVNGSEQQRNCIFLVLGNPG